MKKGVEQDNWKLFHCCRDDLRKNNEQKKVLGARPRPQGAGKNKTALSDAVYCLSPLSESNQRPTDYKSVALPAELRRPIFIPNP